MRAADLLAELMAPFVGGPAPVDSAPTVANAANSAKSEHPCGFPANKRACDGLRIAANDLPDSQPVAAVRNLSNRAESEQRRGVSQNSQHSQGVPAHVDSQALAAVAWTDADVSRFIARRDRLMRWGWRETDAETLAERLTIRDRDGDGRASCTECRHYRPGRCSNHQRAGLWSPEVGRDLAAVLQRCPGFVTEG